MDYPNTVVHKNIVEISVLTKMDKFEFSFLIKISIQEV